MAAFWAVFTFGGRGPDITAHGSLDLKQEIQIQIHFMAAFWAVSTFGGSGPALTAHGSLDLKQEIQIQIQMPQF
jgi:hypothetical protein